PAPPGPRRRPVLIVAGVLALVALVGTSVVVGASIVIDAGRRGAAPPVEQVSVFLCVRSSANQRCGRADATARQKADLERDLRRAPGVQAVEYESVEAAYERLKRRFADNPELRDNVRVGHVPDAYRVRVAGRRDAEALQRSMSGRPGVDQVVIQPRPAAETRRDPFSGT
ncbi:permease-like cell division protein FtsX, partial [Actinomadura kijaniata]|uniref:permease-like cell division protein FtsX n=1 Tax=Actinomadura kijaniata TaxID=46161 RepID=UPI003F1B824C